MLLTRDDDLSRRYLGDPTSHFPDVRTDHFAYNAANLGASLVQSAEFQLLKGLKGSQIGVGIFDGHEPGRRHRHGDRRVGNGLRKGRQLRLAGTRRHGQRRKEPSQHAT